MKITNYKPVDKGVVVATFDCEIEEWGTTFRRLTFFRKDNKSWIGFPSQKFDGKDGKPAYYSYIVMEKEKKERFDKSCIGLIDAGKYEGGKAPVVHPTDEEVPW